MNGWGVIGAEIKRFGIIGGLPAALASRPGQPHLPEARPGCIWGLAGEWRSLVAHLLWEQGVAGSNPVSPTNFFYRNISVFNSL